MLGHQISITKASLIITSQNKTQSLLIITNQPRFQLTRAIRLKNYFMNK